MSYEPEAFTIAEKEFEKAGRRIIATSNVHGGQEPAAVGWLLSFLALDVGQRTARQQDELWGDVVRFCIDAGQGNTALGRVGGVQYQYCSVETAADRTNTIVNMQRDTRAALEGFMRTGLGTFPKGEGAFSLMRGSWLVPGDQPLRYRGGDLPSSFYYMAAYLLARYGHRVKQCRGCPLIMLVGRKDQRYHSQTCQIGSFVRRKRAKDKAQRLAREQRKQMRAQHKKAARKRVKGKKPKQQKGTRHGTKR